MIPRMLVNLPSSVYAARLEAPSQVSAGLGKARQFSEQAAPFVRSVASQAKNPYVLGSALLLGGVGLAWRKFAQREGDRGLRSIAGGAWEQGKKWIQQIPLGRIRATDKRVKKTAKFLKNADKTLQKLQNAKTKEDAHKVYISIRNHAWESAEALQRILPFRKWIPNFYLKTVSQTAEKADDYRKKALSLRLSSQWDQKG